MIDDNHSRSLRLPVLLHATLTSSIIMISVIFSALFALDFPRMYFPPFVDVIEYAI